MQASDPDETAKPAAGNSAGAQARLWAAAQEVATCSPNERRFVRDARWWPAVAALVGALAGAGAAPVRDLRRVRVIVPRRVHGTLLRAALHAAQEGACIAPRVQTLEDWAGLDAFSSAPQHAELFEALRGNAWVRDQFGANAGALWALARDAALLSDELTLAAAGAVEAFTGRWRAAVQRHFSQRAIAAGEPQSQLVLALWLAGLDPERGAAGLAASLTRCAAAADGPLVWLLPQGAAPWQRAFCDAYRARSGHPAILVVGDDAGLARSCPLLAAAWPELAGTLADAPPIAGRAAALGPTGSGAQARPASLRIWRCNSLEEEAGTAAAWTVQRVQDGCKSIALVALDRLAARRVRALLDRAGLGVADEAGWKLSTTSAAAAVMGWIDLVIADFGHDELLDWLQSPFTLGRGRELGAPQAAVKAGTLAFIGAALLDDGVHAGAGAVRSAVARRAQRAVRDGATDPDAGAALQAIETLVACARPWQQSGSLGRFLGLLDTVLDPLGMRAPLAADPVGAAVLEAVAQLHEGLAGSNLRLGLAEFRAFLAGHLEDLAAPGGAAQGGVVMTTLAATRLRQFDAVLLIGADADHLPGRRGAGGLLAGAVRQDLGLTSDAQHEAEQLRDLASLIAATPRIAATWRHRDAAAPRALSPLLHRLALVTELAGGQSLVADPQAVLRTAAGLPRPARAPRAPGRLPPRLSATAYQDLVDCPYRFFALRVLGLRESERLRALPDKRDLGKVLHRVLFEFHRAGTVANVDIAAVVDGPRAAALPEQRGGDGAQAGALLATIDAVFEPLLRQQPALIAYRQRLRLLVPGYLQWLHADMRQGWQWHAGEAALERVLPLAAAPASMRPDLPEAITLFGRVDRIDAGPGGLRILDYKARDAAALRREQKDPGEAVQLLFYGLLFDPPATEAAYLSLQPPREPRDPAAGVAKPVPAPSPYGEYVALLEHRLREDLVRIAGGAALPASGAEPVCRRCELRSLCRHGFAEDSRPAAATLVADPSAMAQASDE